MNTLKAYCLWDAWKSLLPVHIWMTRLNTRAPETGTPNGHTLPMISDEIENEHHKELTLLCLEIWFSFLKYFIFQLCACVSGGCAYECSTEVTGNCETHNVDDGNWTWIL